MYKAISDQLGLQSLLRVALPPWTNVSANHYQPNRGIIPTLKRGWAGLAPSCSFESRMELVSLVPAL